MNNKYPDFILQGNILEPLTIDQLKSLGFEIYYKKKKGQQAFDSCSLDHTKSTWDQVDLVGTFSSQPTFLQIVDQIAENATSVEYNRIKKKLADQLLD